MRGVRDEPALGGERVVQPFQHLVEGIRQFLELVPGAGQCQPFPQVLVRRPAGGLGDHPDWPQHAAGDEPAQRAGGHGHHPEAEQGVQQQAVQCALPDADRGRTFAGGEGLLARDDGPRVGSRLLAGDFQLGQLLIRAGA